MFPRATLRSVFRVTAGLALAGVLLGCRAKDSPLGSDSAATSSPVAAASAEADPRQMIVFAGTSLTAGYGLDPDSAWSHQIQRKIDSAGLPFETVNAGVSGETTAGLVQRLDWILRGKFDLLVIESGANDGLRGVSASAIEKNLREVVRRAREARPNAEILLIQMETLPNYGRAYGTAFHDVYQAVARDMNVRLLPFLLDGVAGRSELNQGDGIHPNLPGERIVAENIWKGLEPVLRQRVGR